MRRAPGLRTLALAAAGAVAAAATCVPAHAEIERDRAFVQRVDGAIARGTQFLVGKQSRVGGWTELSRPLGTTALCYHTLSVCGVPQDDPAMQRAYARIEETFDRYLQSGRLNTYEVALTLMAVEDHVVRGRPTEAEQKVDRTWMTLMVRFLERVQADSGGWSYGSGGTKSATYDNSNTQYALLGLKAAARAGVSVRPSTFRKALDHFVHTQQATGPKVRRRTPRFAPGKGKTAEIVYDRARGWGYTSARNGKTGAYGSMTAGGVGSVVICRSELLGTPGYDRKADRVAETSVRDGIAWLGKHFEVKRNPPFTGRHRHAYYYLYGLERAGVLAAVDHMGDHDWYGKGARYLIGDQARDGSWREHENDAILRTCFALLFLRRGTTAVRRGSLQPVTGESAINFDVAADLSTDDFDDFIDMVLSRYRRASGDAARAGILEGVTQVGPRIVLPLLRRMDANDERRRGAAHAVLRHATGLDFPFDARAGRDRRAELLEPWEVWFLKTAGKLSYDSATGRLVAAP